ncbi:cyclic lactone autoinducer peptide [Enterococcus ratti]|uniref:Cyclic lactone autoinducer peptide n=1 Tax=Enterococcus ratti TaxID=150033 RepID=A0A1L8WSK6_9ENTE|nr:cyclic lactone autoinducer peptide [Enterococcus ratti]OJG83994.1 cyclic lactone autoinducer peptide [Enterococcus ratti]
MFKNLKFKHFKFLQFISTVAIAVATQAIASQHTCTLAVYEPKMPEALKKEMTK